MLAFVRGIDHDNMTVMYVVTVMYVLSLLCLGPFREQPYCTAPRCPDIARHAIFWSIFLCARTAKTVVRVDIVDVDRIVEDAGDFDQRTAANPVTPMVVRAGRRSTGK